jgi:hypothetical protein
VFDVRLDRADTAAAVVLEQGLGTRVRAVGDRLPQVADELLNVSREDNALKAS